MARSRYAGQEAILRRWPLFRATKSGHGRIAREPFLKIPNSFAVSRREELSRVKRILSRTISNVGKVLRVCPEYAHGSAGGSGPHRPYWLARVQLMRHGDESA